MQFLNSPFCSSHSFFSSVQSFCVRLVRFSRILFIHMRVSTTNYCPYLAHTSFYLLSKTKRRTTSVINLINPLFIYVFMLLPLVLLLLYALQITSSSLFASNYDLCEKRVSNKINCCFLLLLPLLLLLFFFF